MSDSVPNSYKDPYWQDVASKAESKVGLPTGLLTSIVTNGEKTNNDQVSEAGAKTVFQIIPSTRDAGLKKYGIDAYLSAENAAEVAARLLKDSLDRNKGDSAQAIGEYHGGTNRENWGARTKAYIDRVSKGMELLSLDKLGNDFGAWLEKNPAIPAQQPTQQPSGNSALAAGFGAWLETQGSQVSKIPTDGPLPKPTPDKPESLTDKAIGAGEAALSTVSGLTTGALAGSLTGLGGVAKSILAGAYGTPQAADLVEQAAQTAAGQMTYQPRTQSGANQAAALSGALEAVAPAMGIPGEVGALAAGVKAGLPLARSIAAPAVAAGVDSVKQGTMPILDAVKSGAAKASEYVGMGAPETAASPGRASMGAAAVAAAEVRERKAADLPVSMRLTLGEQDRDPNQLAFEKEQLKGPLGDPLRAKAEDSNHKFLQNFDALIDRTDAQAPDLTKAGSGNAVVKALSNGWEAAKNATRIAYKLAKDSDESKIIVDTSPIIDHLNSVPNGSDSAVIINRAKRYAVSLGVAELGSNGKLIPKPASVSTLEALRKEINQAPATDAIAIRDSTILKKLIDAQTDPVAGPLYKAARALRTTQARKYENRAIIANLITNRRGMSDPKVAIDNVFNRTILNGSPEEITFLKRVLLTSGEEGQQAWKELQGATIAHIKEHAISSGGMDSADRPILSPAKAHQAISNLDKNGRHDLVLGTKTAQIIRDLNDVLKYVNTVPPGTLINNSGTVGTLLAAIGEAGATGALTGLPVPVLSIMRALGKHIANTKIKVKIQKALNAK